MTKHYYFYSQVSSSLTKLILKKSLCIHIKQGIFPVFSNILTILDRAERHRDFHIPISDPRSIQQVAELMSVYDQVYVKSHRCIDIQEKHPLEVAQDLFSEFASQ